MIDLNQQLIDLFKKERMLAFFDFELPLGGTERISGLCKISRPRGFEQQSQYFSLLFLIDTPDDASWEQVESFVKKINWSAFRGELPGVETVLSIPHLDQGKGIYFKEADIYFTGDVVLTKSYVSSHLYPAILRVTGLKAGELVLWDNAPERKQEIKKIVSEKQPGRPLVARLKNFLGF